ncbi:MAG TPA: hypothetical protein VGQ33_06085, partial [Vicinamibacteria bacterium]|nr:hypothetical protein [Vicinamibacteria bacterium]
PFHLINVKRLAYELPRDQRPAAGLGGAASAPPAAAGRPGPTGDLSSRVAAFVAERVGGAAAAGPAPATPSTPPAPATSAAVAKPPGGMPARPSVDFVAEDDVRRALFEGRTITLRRGAIVTPAARDLASGKDVLVEER